MKAITIPKPMSCAKTLAPGGEITLATFVRELVFPRPAWRERGKSPLLLEIDAKLDAPAGTEIRISDEAYELLCREAQFPETQIRPDATRVVAQFQGVLYSAVDAAELREAAE